MLLVKSKYVCVSSRILATSLQILCDDSIGINRILTTRDESTLGLSFLLLLQDRDLFSLCEREQYPKRTSHQVFTALLIYSIIISRFERFLVRISSTRYHEQFS